MMKITTRLMSTPILLSLLASMPAAAQAPAAQPADKTANVEAAITKAEVTPTTPSDLAASVAAIEKIAEAKRIELGVPGASLVIVKDDKIILMKGFGLREVERRLPVTPDTLFDTQSVTKPFTAAAVMMSVDDGKLSLEDSPKKFLPYLKFRDPEMDANVTLRDLLCHRTGLAGANLTWLTRALNRTELIRVIALAKPTAKLRKQFQYNNPMYSVVGEVVAKAQNSTYERVITDRILKPLNMRASNLSVRELQRSPDFAFGYEFTDVPGELKKYPFFDYSTINPAGGLNSNARDMSQFLRLMLGEGAIDGQRLISEKSIREMLAPQIWLGPTGFWALGWSSRGTWNGHRVFFHAGATEGFNSIIALMPDQKLGFALLTNISASPLARGTVEDAIWTNLVGKQEPGGFGTPFANPAGNNGSSQPSASFAAPFSVEELMVRMTNAAGGETNLRKHKSAVTTATLDYEQQGITGNWLIHAQSPNSWSRSIALVALDRKLGTIHEFFDGANGGAETSFLPPQVFAGDQFQDLKTASDFYPLLNWKTLFKSVTINGISKIGDEDVYIVVKTPEKGTPVADYVSAKTFLVLRRETTNRGNESYRDYRNVDGVMMPFKIEANFPGIGNVVVSVKDIKFDVKTPASVFRARVNADTTSEDPTSVRRHGKFIL